MGLINNQLTLKEKKMKTGIGLALGFALLVGFLVMGIHASSPTVAKIEKISELQGCSIYHHYHMYGGSTFVICK